MSGTRRTRTPEEIDHLERVEYTPRPSGPQGEPFPDCLTCRRFEVCPLRRYRPRCSFRALYERQAQ